LAPADRSDGAVKNAEHDEQELTLERAARRRSLLAEPQPLKDWVVLKPKSLRRPEFDAARQTLLWALLDYQGNALNAEVPYDTYTAPVIERLELFEPKGDVLVVARLRGGSTQLVAEPLSVVDIAARGTATPVDSLYFDAAPKDGMVGKLLAKLRRQASAAEPVSTPISPIPKLLTDAKRWLALQAERGLADESATTALDQLHGRLKRLIAAGFSAFGSASNADAATELLRTHYLCMQYEHLIDDSDHISSRATIEILGGSRADVHQRPAYANLVFLSAAFALTRISIRNFLAPLELLWGYEDGGHSLPSIR
jgi:hypothetical protein